jgi:hypothetical protein
VFLDILLFVIYNKVFIKPSVAPKQGLILKEVPVPVSLTNNPCKDIKVIDLEDLLKPLPI